MQKRKIIFGITCLIFFPMQGMLKYFWTGVSEEFNRQTAQERKEIVSNLPDIKTKRFFLRKLRENDAQKLLSITSDNHVFALGDIAQYETLEAAQEYVLTILEQYKKGQTPFWMIEDLKNKEVVGLIRYPSINDAEGEASLDYMMRSEFGDSHVLEVANVAIEFVFNDLKLSSVKTSIDESNVSLSKILKDIGMKKGDRYGENRRFYHILRGFQEKDYLFYKRLAVIPALFDNE
ncbi:MAG: GNAT family N-acetyltransferase [Candidatus Babeliaceae bacterium]